MSKGHASPAIYSILHQLGIISKEDILSFRKLGSVCQGHVDMKWTEGVDFSAGSLGMGLSYGLGCALAAKMDKSERNIWVMIGDGETQEGQIWEAAMYATHHKIDNIIATVDYNGRQIDGDLEDVMTLGDLRAKWESFGWIVLEMDGHDFENILAMMAEAKSLSGQGRPICMLMRTEMGQGVDFMMGTHKWHGSPPNDEQLASALSQLEESLGDYPA